MNANHRSAVLVILDGWGIGPAWGGNAISQAKTPFFNWLGKGPHAVLAAAGEAVGLAPGQHGNSEVGHLNLGAGRIVPQGSELITKVIAQGKLKNNSVLVNACTAAVQKNKRIHLLGLLSSAKVHSVREHLLAILQVLKTNAVRDVRLHLFMDGRDSDPRDGLSQILSLEKELTRLQLGTIQTVTGRYYAMDRDHHWDRIEKTFLAIAQGVGIRTGGARLAISRAYSQGITDEFIEPTIIEPTGDHPYQGIEEGDTLIFWNHRADRARQLTQAFAQTPFDGFDRPVVPTTQFLTLTPYGTELVLPNVQSIFPPDPIPETLAEVIAENNGRQFHIAETEKYAHVTYFFNGGHEAAFPGEDRLLIPSPKVLTYDLMPEMSASRITQRLLRAIKSKKYMLLVANYANADMVGHTGNFTACVRAIETLDQEMRKIAELCHKHHIPLIITADHGNAEQKVNPLTGEPSTEHTSGPVPLYIIAPQTISFAHPTGMLADVAPTLLSILGLPIPAVMTGTNLLAQGNFDYTKKI